MTRCGGAESSLQFDLSEADNALQAAITQKVINGVYPGVTTVELDTLVRLQRCCAAASWAIGQMHVASCFKKKSLFCAGC